MTPRTSLAALGAMPGSTQQQRAHGSAAPASAAGLLPAGGGRGDLLRPAIQRERGRTPWLALEAPREPDRLGRVYESSIGMATHASGPTDSYPDGQDRNDLGEPLALGAGPSHDRIPHGLFEGVDQRSLLRRLFGLVLAWLNVLRISASDHRDETSHLLRPGGQPPSQRTLDTAQLFARAEVS